MTTRLLFINDIVGRMVDALTAIGLKQDRSNDPAAPSPGPSFRLFVEGIEPMHDAQRDATQEVLRASLSLVINSQTSGGNRSGTSVELASWAEKVADVVRGMHDTYGDMDVTWDAARLFVGDGDLTKLAMTITVEY